MYVCVYPDDPQDGQDVGIQSPDCIHAKPLLCEGYDLDDDIARGDQRFVGIQQIIPRPIDDWVAFIGSVEHRQKRRRINERQSSKSSAR